MREATVHLPQRALESEPFGGVLGYAREAGLRDLSEVVCRAPGCILVLTVETPMDESAVTDAESVVWLERIETTAESVVYLCELRPETTESLPAVTNREISVERESLTLSLVGPQSAIADAVTAYEDRGVSPSLERLGDYEGPSGPLDALTARQQAVVETAFEMGYFEVPRTADTADVAAELGVDRSTVTEHLQRAEHNLFARLLGE